MYSSPEMFPIAEFIKWNSEGTIALNPTFQRSPVWTASAKSFLIDTILNGMPIPVILFRTNIDRNSQKIYRDVVDGQQRLRAILGFAANDFPLGARSGPLQGKFYKDLDPEQQDSFLSYKLPTTQLINASDEDVLEVFLRINSYTVPLNHPEIRNAKYDSEFKWSVSETAKGAHQLWDLGVFTDRQRVRLNDQTLVAELYGFALDGLRDGGQTKVNALYERTKKRPENLSSIEQQVRSSIETAAALLSDFQGEQLIGPPHVLLIVAAIMHGRYGLPAGELGANMPDREGILENWGVAKSNLSVINNVLNGEVTEQRWARFQTLSKSSTQRLSGRKVRFPVFVEALKPIPFDS